MGVVFEARHDRLSRPAALKVLSSWLTSELGRARFEREVQACAQLTHANTVEIYDYGESEDGTLYYAMEYLDGYDLGRLVEVDGPQAPARAIRVLHQIAGALGEAHELGLVHRDIKPPNILLCEAGGVPDVAKLVDFGLVAPIRPTRERLTIEGFVIGTPRYVAPEMLKPRVELSSASDFYALGLVAYFLLSGRHAFDGESTADILKKQRDEAPAALEGVPADLASVIGWCLEKDPSARPANAKDLQESLSSCADAKRWDEEAARAWWDAWRQSASAPSPSRSEQPAIASSPSITAPERPSAKEDREL